MIKGLPIALTIPVRLKKDRGAAGKEGKTTGQVFTLLKQFVLRFAKRSTKHTKNSK